MNNSVDLWLTYLLEPLSREEKIARSLLGIPENAPWDKRENKIARKLFGIPEDVVWDNGLGQRMFLCEMKDAFLLKTYLGCTQLSTRLELLEEIRFRGLEYML